MSKTQVRAPGTRSTRMLLDPDVARKFTAGDYIWFGALGRIGTSVQVAAVNVETGEVTLACACSWNADALVHK